MQAIAVGTMIEIFGFMSSTSAFWRAGLIDFRIAGFAVLFAAPMAVLGGYAPHFMVPMGLFGMLFKEGGHWHSHTGAEGR